MRLVAVLLISALLAAPALAQVKQQRSEPKKTESANGNFYTDIFSQLEKGESAAYSTAFSKAIEKGENGKAETWEGGRIFGEITPGERFQNKMGQSCRRFSEWYQFGELRQTFKGVACPQQPAGWCKLHPTSVASCGLEKPGGWDGFKIDASNSWRSMWSWWPF